MRVLNVPGPQPITIRNLGTAAHYVDQANHVLAFLASESDQGFQDLNGDGDVLDLVLHLDGYPWQSFGWNQGLAADPVQPIFGARTGQVILAVSEAAQGFVDLNGDGDAADAVVHAFDVGSGTWTNTQIALSSLAELEMGQGHTAFLASEAANASDLNGDGDTVDHIACSWSHVSQTLQVTGLASRGELRVSDTLLLVGVWEGGQGQDLNGDGDLLDDVVHVFDILGGQSLNLGLAHSSYPPVLEEDDVFGFPVSEWEQGGTDLNQDGDPWDFVLHTYDHGSGNVWNIGVGIQEAASDDDHWAFLVAEFEQGGTDLNGDGDNMDFVLHEFDARNPAPGSLTNAAIATDGQLLEVYNDVVAFDVHELGEQVDLNGDGDQLDSIPTLLDRGTLTVGVTSMASTGGRHLQGNRLMYLVFEQDEGHTDLNGDGDLLDYVLHELRGSGQTTNYGLAATFDVNNPGLPSWWVSEADHGGSDLNGDGDAQDQVFFAIDGFGTIVNTGLVASTVDPTLHPGWQSATFLVSEAGHGGTDLNGDGDTADDVVFHVHR